MVAVWDTQNLGDFFKGFFVDLHLKTLAFYWPAHHFLLLYRPCPPTGNQRADCQRPGKELYISCQVCLTPMSRIRKGQADPDIRPVVE